MPIAPEHEEVVAVQFAGVPVPCCRSGARLSGTVYYLDLGLQAEGLGTGGLALLSLFDECVVAFKFFVGLLE